MNPENENLNPETTVPADETAWTVLCELIGEDKATKFCRAFVRGRKVQISSRKFFMFADTIGAVAAKKVIDTFDGERVCLPEIQFSPKDIRERDSAIRQVKGKVPQEKLAQIAGISKRQIKRIQNERE